MASPNLPDSEPKAAHLVAAQASPCDELVIRTQPATVDRPCQRKRLALAAFVMIEAHSANPMTGSGAAHRPSQTPVARAQADAISDALRAVALVCAACAFAGAAVAMATIHPLKRPPRVRPD